MEAGMKRLSAKVYVTVEVRFEADGRIIPQVVHWEDDTAYRIDRVLDVRSAAAMKGGGVGDRYLVRINGQTCSIFFEHNPDQPSFYMGRWFVERKGA